MSLATVTQDSVMATLRSTGEVLFFRTATPDELVESYKLLNEYAKALEAIKKELQTQAQEIVNEKGVYESGGYAIRVSHIQRYNYDKAQLRRIFDQDLMDQFLEPAKSRIDTYLKENLEDLGTDAMDLRGSMQPVGKPYTVVKLERLTRE